MNTRLLAFCRLVLLAAVVTMAATGCARVSRERTLPPSINDVTIPLFVNRTAEPAIEERATVFTQEEFLADGRLDLVPVDDADAVIGVELTRFDSEGAGFDSDDFPRRLRYTVEAEVTIAQNIPGRPRFGPRRTVTASRSFINDPRRITYETKEYGQEEVLRELARRIVREVLTGGFDDYEESFAPEEPLTEQSDLLF